MSDRKRCAYCAEEIHQAAVRCPHCRSRLDGFAVEHWHRAHEDSRFAGVAAAVAHALSVPVGLVRLAFVLAAFVHLLGVIAYLVLWAIIPAVAGEPSVLERGLVRAQDWARGLAGRPRGGDSSDRKPAVAVPTDGPSVINDGGDAQR